MSKLARENLIYLLLSSIVVVGGYWFLRYAYHVADKAPFSQEIVLIILGAIITMLITALLLNKQTEVELKKEESIKFIELKTGIYIQLIDHIQQVMLGGDVDREDRIRLRILAHKLAIVAAPDVLQQFEHLVERFTNVTRDNEVAQEDVDVLMEELAKLSVCIRKDLIGDLDDRQGIDQEKVTRQIMENSDAFGE